MRMRAGVVVAFLAVLGACGSEADEVGSAAPESTTTTEATTTTVAPTTTAVVVSDRATQSNLRNALSAEKVIYADNEAYTDDVATLRDIEPAVPWAQGVSPTVAGSVSVAVSADKQLVCLSAVSSTGTVFVLADSVDDGPSYGRAAIGSCDKATVRRLAKSWG